MYKIDYKNIKMNYGFYSIFLCIGLIFSVVFSIFMFSPNIKKMSLDGEVKASKIDLNANGNTYSPSYYYIVDGVNYVCDIPYSTNVNVEDMKNLDKIYYNTNNPSECAIEYDVKINWFEIFACIFLSMFTFIGIFGIVKTRKKINNMKYLCKFGILIKDLEYELVPSNIKVNNKIIYSIQVDYKKPDGTIIKLKSYPKYDMNVDDDGRVDLLIDPNNLDLYYIDFKIEQGYNNEY